VGFGGRELMGELLLAEELEAELGTADTEDTGGCEDDDPLGCPLGWPLGEAEADDTGAEDSPGG